jgi:hypothetical protein
MPVDPTQKTLAANLFFNPVTPPNLSILNHQVPAIQAKRV